MGGPDRLSRADIAEAVALAHGYDTGLIQRVPAASGEAALLLAFGGCLALPCRGWAAPWTHLLLAFPSPILTTLSMQSPAPSLLLRTSPWTRPG